jgi:hypothetical protein
MSKPLLHAVRLTLFGAVVLWGLIALANPDGAISLLERTLAPDGHIRNRTRPLYVMGSVLLALALIGPVLLERWRSALADLARGSRWSEGSEVLLVFALVLIHATGIVYYDFSQDYFLNGIYREDGPLEYLTALLAIGAAVLILIGLPRCDRPSRIFASLVAIAAILFAGEEISWGQRIFGFESTGIFATANSQGETNFHNFSPAILQHFNFLDLAVAIWLLNIRAATRWLVTRIGSTDIAPLVNPRNNLILATVMFGLWLHCEIYGGELSEEVLAVMLFYGSLRFMLARRAAAGRIVPARSLGQVSPGR